MKIELRKRPDYRGARYIVVDGVHWGIVHADHHGRYGLSFSVGQAGSGGVLMGSNGRPFTIRREKQSTASVDEVLLPAITQLIEQGRLVHPDIIAARKKSVEEVYAKWKTDQNAKRHAKALTIVLDLMDRHGLNANGVNREFAEAMATRMEHINPGVDL